MPLPNRFVASILANIFGPSIYDDHRFGRGDLTRIDLTDLVVGPSPDPWQAVRLHPQPLLQGARYAMALADAHIQEVFNLERIGSLWGGEVEGRTMERGLQHIIELDELCPRWPRWPKRWPPPPPPFWERNEMNATELFVYGSRMLAAADLLGEGPLRESLSRLGEKALDLSQSGHTGGS